MVKHASPSDDVVQAIFIKDWGPERINISANVRNYYIQHPTHSVETINRKVLHDEFQGTPNKGLFALIRKGRFKPLIQSTIDVVKKELAGQREEEMIDFQVRQLEVQDIFTRVRTQARPVTITESNSLTGAWRANAPDYLRDLTPDWTRLIQENKADEIIKKPTKYYAAKWFL